MKNHIFIIMIALLTINLFATDQSNTETNISSQLEEVLKNDIIKSTIILNNKAIDIREKIRLHNQAKYKKYDIDKMWKEKLQKANVKDNRKSIKKNVQRLMSKNSIYNSLDKDINIYRYKTLNIVGENIQNRNNIYDFIYLEIIVFLNLFVSLILFILPFFIFIYLLPIMYRIALTFSHSLKDYSYILFFLLITAILSYSIYLYTFILFDSFGTFLIMLLLFLFLFVLALVLIPLIFIAFIVFLSNDVQFSFYPDGTLVNIFKELIMMNLNKYNIDIAIDTAMLLFIFKMLFLSLIISNMFKGVQLIFIKSNQMLVYFLSVVFISVFLYLIYHFNNDKIMLIINTIKELI